MFRQIASPRYTATISKTGLVTKLYDDGWEDIVDCKQQFSSEVEARNYLSAQGYEEYDANASLKAMGLKWNGYCYA
jgi:hypothetical protein